MQNNFPERLAMYCVIEPNWVFKIAYAAMRMFLSQATLNKVKMLGSLEDLKEWYEPSELIEAHGGTAPVTFDPIAEFGLSKKDDQQEAEEKQ